MSVEQNKELVTKTWNAFVKGDIKTAFANMSASEVRRIYGDGDTVIIEMTNRGKLGNGKDYENEYCFVFEVENGKVRRVREYVDTQKVVTLTS